ncbi:MAG: hypothetical protein LUG44_05470 [Clostridiales bacterium]|nr:hypothetical protein [Clostridiales bacterium]
MDTNTVSLVISIAALLASVAFPIATALINGHYTKEIHILDLEEERRKHDQDYYDAHRSAVIERFINSASAASYSRGTKTCEEFFSASGEIYIYLDESLWPLVDSIQDEIIRNKGDATRDIRELCKALSHEKVRVKAKSSKKPNRNNAKIIKHHQPKCCSVAFFAEQPPANRDADGDCRK